MSLEPSEHLTPDGEFLVKDSGLQVTPSSGGFQRPDFVMVGVQHQSGTGVILFASMTLNSAELKRKIDREDPFDFVQTGFGVARLPRERVTVSAEMRNFTIIQAGSYPEAIKSLHEQWSRQAPVPGNALPPGI